MQLAAMSGVDELARGAEMRAVARVLARAARAHHDHEQRELGGARDRDWPEWYAGYALRHGIGEPLGQSVSEGQLAELLRLANDAFEAQRPAQRWESFTAAWLLARMARLAR